MIKNHHFFIPGTKTARGYLFRKRNDSLRSIVYSLPSQVEVIPRHKLHRHIRRRSFVTNKSSQLLHQLLNSSSEYLNTTTSNSSRMSPGSAKNKVRYCSVIKHLSAQIRSKGGHERNGTFSDQISVHFGSASQNVLNLI